MDWMQYKRPSGCCILVLSAGSLSKLSNCSSPYQLTCCQNHRSIFSFCTCNDMTITRYCFLLQNTKLLLIKIGYPEVEYLYATRRTLRWSTYQLEPILTMYIQGQPVVFFLADENTKSNVSFICKAISYQSLHVAVQNARTPLMLLRIASKDKVKVKTNA